VTVVYDESLYDIIRCCWRGYSVVIRFSKALEMKYRKRVLPSIESNRIGIDPNPGIRSES
jgi:hypothetical protein